MLIVCDIIFQILISWLGINFFFCFFFSEHKSRLGKGNRLEPKEKGKQKNKTKKTKSDNKFSRLELNGGESGLEEGEEVREKGSRFRVSVN